MAILALKKWGGTLGPRKVEVGPLKTVFEKKRVSSKRFAPKLKKQPYCNNTFIIDIHYNIRWQNGQSVRFWCGRLKI